MFQCISATKSLDLADSRNRAAIATEDILAGCRIPNHHGVGIGAILNTDIEHFDGEITTRRIAGSVRRRASNGSRA